VDVFTKNLYGPLYEKHIKTYIGMDQYMYEGTDWTLVAQKKKRKAESGHGKSSRGNGPGFDRGSA
jgi:hypothetical protein